MPLPCPAITVKEDEEMDELLMWDDELEGASPEELPRRRLLDFSIYNAEVSTGCRYAIHLAC